HKMNPLIAFIRFLIGKPGSLRFGAAAYDDDIRNLKYDTIADGKRNLRNDMRRLGKDWRKAIKSVSENGTKG
ncbi:MAG: hypothetical protein K2J24_05970, partial [Muribaculaceae bacterium]|nr:hypothetical protein [Muribaculaceae bacterium]